LNLKNGSLDTVDFRTLCGTIEHPDLFYAVSLQDNGHLAPPMFKTQDLQKGESCLTFENLLTKTDFIPLAKKVLSKIESEYGRPVDVEFAWDENRLYILQCRSLSTRKELEKVVIPSILPEEQVLFRTQAGLSNTIVNDLEYIVYVNPKAYDALQSYEKKMNIGTVINHLNKHFAEKWYALMGPGRWGSNDINLGVKVTYADINSTKLLVEIAFAKEGYTPEVSYGTHFFQDLVEADIAMVPLFPDDPGARLNERFLLEAENILGTILPAAKDCEEVVRVIHVPSTRPEEYLQVYLDAFNQKGIGFFGPKEGRD
jgi:hypothetical protein